MAQGPPGGHTAIASAVAAIVRALKSHGVDDADILQSVGLTTGVLQTPDARVDSATIDALLVRAVEISGDEAIGLTLGQQFATFAHHLHFLIMASATLEQALQTLLQFQAVLGGAVRLALIQGDVYSRLEYTCPRPTGAPWVPCDTLATSQVLTIRSLLLDPTTDPVELELWRPAPANIEPFETLFRCPIRFDRPINAIVVANSTLQRSIPTSNAQMYALLETVVRRYVEALSDFAWASRLRRLLVIEMRNGRPKRAAMARRLGLSVRSLARQLALEGTSYRAVLQDVLVSIARDYFREGGSSVTEVAFALGFSDTAAFSRAFKRWTQRTPSQFARENGAG